MNSDQWSLFIDSLSLIVGIGSIIYAFRLYKKQRKDNAKEAFIFFQDSLTDLDKALTATIDGLELFSKSLEEEHFQTPSISASLNDKFIQKINSVDLSRYYRKKRKNKILLFRKFMVNLNFLSDYQSCFANNIGYLQNFYLQKEPMFQEWQHLRTYNQSEVESPSKFAKVYKEWLLKLYNDSEILDHDKEQNLLTLKSRKRLVEKHLIPIAYDSYEFVKQNITNANDVNKLANQVISAHIDIEEFKSKMKIVIDNDIKKFVKIKNNLNEIIEKQANA